MTKRLNVNILFTGFIVAILLLMAIQLYWFRAQYALQKARQDDRALIALKKTLAIALENKRCFEVYAKLYIKPGEGYYMIKPHWDSTGILSVTDTVPMFYVGNGQDNSVPPGMFKSLLFSGPMIADVHVKFEYEMEEDTTRFLENARRLSATIDPLRVKALVNASAPLFKQLDTTLLKKLLVENLAEEGIPSSYTLAALQAEDRKLVYHTPGSFAAGTLSSPIKTTISENSFFARPYDIYLAVEYTGFSFSGGLLGLFIVSALILTGLAIGVWYFIRNIQLYKNLVEVKNDLISNLSHELNTPVTNIGLAIDTLLLQVGLAPGEQQKILQIIARENDLLKENVESILQISRMESGNLELDRQSLDLVALIGKVISDFDLVVRSRQAKLEFKTGSGPIFYNGDAAGLRNVLSNLLDNALKYSPQKPEIHISLAVQNDQLHIAVKDNGIGIDKEQLDRVFEKFYRVPKGDTHDVKGFGLGLAYVQLIITAHGGSVKVTSRPGEGSTFHLYLPLKQTAT